MQRQLANGDYDHSSVGRVNSHKNTRELPCLRHSRAGGNPVLLLKGTVKRNSLGENGFVARVLLLLLLLSHPKDQQYSVSFTSKLDESMRCH